MVAWHLREHRELVDRDQVLAKVSRVCLASWTAPTADDARREACELRLRSEALGAGARVSGTVEVSGSVDLVR
jgi:hypothetical protein